MPFRPRYEADGAIYLFSDTVRCLLADLHYAQSQGNRAGITGAITRVGFESLELLSYLNTLPFPNEWIPSLQWGKSL